MIKVIHFLGKSCRDVLGLGQDFTVIQYNFAPWVKTHGYDIGRPYETCLLE